MEKIFKSFAGKEVFVYVKDKEKEDLLRKLSLKNVNFTTRIEHITRRTKAFISSSKHIQAWVELHKAGNKKSSRGSTAVQKILRENTEVNLWRKARGRNPGIKFFYWNIQGRTEDNPQQSRFEFDISEDRKKYPNCYHYIITDGKGVHKIRPHIVKSPPKIYNHPCSYSGSLFRKPSLSNSNLNHKKSIELRRKRRLCDGCGETYVNMDEHERSEIHKSWAAKQNFRGIDIISESFQKRKVNQNQLMVKESNEKMEMSPLFKRNKPQMRIEDDQDKVRGENGGVPFREKMEWKDSQMKKGGAAKNTEVFNIQCNICHKGFKTEAILKRHKVTHIKRYKCTLCSRGFIKKWNLRQHYKTHGNLGNEKGYVCKQLVNGRCCGKVFLRKFSFERHRKSHRGEISRSFKCGVCGMAFVLKHQLTSHASTHGNNKTFKCFFCDVLTTTRYNLKRHVQRKHKGKPRENAGDLDISMAEANGDDESKAQ